MRDHILTEEHVLFRDAVQAFLEKEAVPHNETWEKKGRFLFGSKEVAFPHRRFKF